MASPRRQGREVALQVLCAIDANPDVGAAAALEVVVSHLLTSEDDDGELPGADVFDRGFAETLLRAATGNREKIDETISQISRTWRLDRMARVDRNVLRLAVAEILFLPEVPARVTINEAVELAKRYGAAESSAFVNGLLDSVIKALDVRK
jgi:N utilization substance protein B